MAKPKAKKRKKVLVSAAVRQQDGKPTEPYRIMQDLIDEHREDLAEAKIEILWRSGWRPDSDGEVQMYSVKKAGDVDRALSVKADFALLLNKELFPKLPDKFKQIYVHQALCHMKPLFDSDGEQKQDDKGRALWRVRKRFEIQQFNEIVKVYGEDCLHLDADARQAIADAGRPLIQQAEQVEAKRSKAGKAGSGTAATATTGGTDDDDSWKSEPLGVLNLDDAVETFIADAGHKTIGALSAYMAEKGQWWAKDMQVGGRRKPANFAQKVEDGFAAYWTNRANKVKAKPDEDGSDDATVAGDAKW